MNETQHQTMSFRARRASDQDTLNPGERLRAGVSLIVLILIWTVILIPSAICYLWVMLFNREGAVRQAPVRNDYS